MLGPAVGARVHAASRYLRWPSDVVMLLHASEVLEVGIEAALSSTRIASAWPVKQSMTSSV